MQDVKKNILLCRRGSVHIAFPKNAPPMAVYINSEFFQVTGRANCKDGIFSFTAPLGKLRLHLVFPGLWDQSVSVSNYDWETDGDWTNTVEVTLSGPDTQAYFIVKSKLFGLVYLLEQSGCPRRKRRGRI